MMEVSWQSYPPTQVDLIHSHGLLSLHVQVTNCFILNCVCLFFSISHSCFSVQGLTGITSLTIKARSKESTENLSLFLILSGHRITGVGGDLKRSSPTSPAKAGSPQTQVESGSHKGPSIPLRREMVMAITFISFLAATVLRHGFDCLCLDNIVGRPMEECLRSCEQPDRKGL